MKRQARKTATTLSNRELRKLKKKQRLQMSREERDWSKGWFLAEANALCGCCQVTMRFKSRASASEAFRVAGLGHLTMTDDAGDVHEGVDTFYGFWEAGKDERRSLGYLMAQVTGRGSWPT